MTNLLLGMSHEKQLKKPENAPQSRKRSDATLKAEEFEPREILKPKGKKKKSPEITGTFHKMRI